MRAAGRLGAEADSLWPASPREDAGGSLMASLVLGRPEGESRTPHLSVLSTRVNRSVCRVTLFIFFKSHLYPRT